MALLEPTFQVNLRDFCSNLVLGQINDMFDAVGIPRGPTPRAVSAPPPR
jgi:hypothetical protein